MSQEVSNRLVALRDFYVERFRSEGRHYNFRPEVLAQQVYLALSAVEAKPLIEDVENQNAAPTGEEVRGDRPVVPPGGG